MRRAPLYKIAERNKKYNKKYNKENYIVLNYIILISHKKYNKENYI